MDLRDEVVDPKDEVVYLKDEVVDSMDEMVDPKDEEVDPTDEVVDPRNLVKCQGQGLLEEGHFYSGHSAVSQGAMTRPPDSVNTPNAWGVTSPSYLLHKTFCGKYLAVSMYGWGAGVSESRGRVGEMGGNNTLST